MRSIIINYHNLLQTTAKAELGCGCTSRCDLFCACVNLGHHMHAYMHEVNRLQALPIDLYSSSMVFMMMYTIQFTAAQI